MLGVESLTVTKLGETAEYTRKTEYSHIRSHLHLSFLTQENGPYFNCCLLSHMFLNEISLIWLDRERERPIINRNRGEYSLCICISLEMARQRTSCPRVEGHEP
jgi:hypothetical protein